MAWKKRARTRRPPRGPLDADHAAGSARRVGQTPAQRLRLAARRGKVVLSLRERFSRPPRLVRAPHPVAAPLFWHGLAPVVARSPETVSFSRHAIACRALARPDARSTRRAVQQHVPHGPADRLPTHQNPHDEVTPIPAGQCTHPTRKTGLLISAPTHICACHKQLVHNSFRKTRQRTIGLVHFRLVLGSNYGV